MISSISGAVRQDGVLRSGLQVAVCPALATSNLVSPNETLVVGAYDNQTGWPALRGYLPNSTGVWWKNWETQQASFAFFGYWNGVAHASASAYPALIGSFNFNASGAAMYTSVGPLTTKVDNVHLYKFIAGGLDYAGIVPSPNITGLVPFVAVGSISRSDMYVNVNETRSRNLSATKAIVASTTNLLIGEQMTVAAMYAIGAFMWDRPLEYDEIRLLIDEPFTPLGLTQGELWGAGSALGMPSIHACPFAGVVR